MELAGITYRYDLVEKILREITYSFTLADLMSAPEETEPYVRKAFTLLEAKLEKHLRTPVTKEPRGMKTETFHSFGYEYITERHCIMGIASLKYTISTREKEILSATITLEDREEDDDKPHVLSLYDELTTLPDLKIAPGVQTTMGDIRLLRQEPQSDPLNLSLIRLHKT